MTDPSIPDEPDDGDDVAPEDVDPEVAAEDLAPEAIDPDEALVDVVAEDDHAEAMSIADAIAAVAPTGVTVLAMPDRADAGLEIAAAIGADIVSPGAELRDAVRERLELVKRRANAGELIAELEASRVTPSVPLRVVTDTDGLRSLASSMRRAERLVERSHEEVRHRLGGRVAGEVAVHPEAIKRAAEEYVEASQRRDAAAAALAEEEDAWAEARNPTDPWPDAERDVSAADAFGAVGDDDAQRRMDLGRFGREVAAWRTSEGSTFRRVVAVAGICLVISLLLVVVIGAPFWTALILPAAVAGWGVAEVRDRERDHADRSVALDNLAAVSAITDRAYGGNDPTAELPPGEDDTAIPQSLVHARARHASATSHANRLRGEFETLVGPDADPHDVDALLRLRDAQYAVTQHQIETTPTVRAATGFNRRLWAKWKVAWAAVDEPPPSLDEAEQAIRLLEARDLHAITVERWRAPAPGEDESTAADGRSLADLRALVDEQVSPIVVVGDDEIDVDRVHATCKALIEETAIVVVV